MPWIRATKHRLTIDELERRVVRALVAVRNDVARQIAEATHEIMGRLNTRAAIDRRLIRQTATFDEYASQVLKDEGADHGKA